MAILLLDSSLYYEIFTKLTTACHFLKPLSLNTGAAEVHYSLNYG